MADEVTQSQPITSTDHSAPLPDVPTFGRPTCSDCGGAREPTATQYSYCVGCGRKRQRKRYRDQREAAGRVVKARAETDSDRRAHLVQSDGHPGPCESCEQPELDGLVLVFEGDPVTDLYSGGTPVALMCQECHTLLQRTNTDQLRRLLRAAQLLHRLNLPRDRVLPDLNTVLAPTDRTK